MRIINHVVGFAGLCGLVASLASGTASADTLYRVPPKAINDVLNAPPLPVFVIGPSGNAFAIATPLRFPPVADLARPMLRLAGLRIDPQTNGIHHAYAYTTLSIKISSEGTASRLVPSAAGAHVVTLPPDARITAFEFSPDGKRYAFANATSHGTDLYVTASLTAAPVRIAGIELNGIFGNPISWMPDGTHIMVRALARQVAAPVALAVPVGPIVQEASGKAGEIVTYEDLLADSHDEDSFDYYATSQLAIVDLSTHIVAGFGPRGIYTSAIASPDGQYVLVERLHRPYSYLFPFERFPTTVAVLNRSGATVSTIVDRPLQDRIPANGVTDGPRDVMWSLGAPASVVWTEALDKGDPRVTVPQRDRVVMQAVQTGSAPVELMRSKERLLGMEWFANDPRAFVTEYDRTTRLSQVWLIDTRTPGMPKAFGEPLRAGDGYHDPGSPMLMQAGNDQPAVTHSGENIFLRGTGLGPDGRRPFLDRVNVAAAVASAETKSATTRVFQSELEPLASVLAIDGSNMLVLEQSPAKPPNVFLKHGDLEYQLTQVADPTPIVRQITRRVVNYTRPDGVKLSFTLYLPPGYKEGTRLPTFLWAYPLEFNDASVASQTTNSAQNFVTLSGASELFMALAGYAVLDNATIPIVGANPETVNDTYVEQLVASAKAAVDEAVAIGVTDPNRVAVGGHSYGAFMTANLLAHTRLFRAGIARSGAYNRTLTPFGFQNETRTYWEATDLYTKMSPFTYANEIKDPLLMIHGMADDNTGTFPIQSQRMFAAIEGNGGTARLVMLPNEAHGYLGRESIATVLAEMVDWLDRWVKVAPAK
jgi:dipeptidyl aminopeptidase/acylaminoacyl peptidase